jgi:protein subunit release factor B
MPIKPEKIKALKEEMERLNINDLDLKEEFILSSSKGGQKVNKTSSSVFLLHIPSNISVKYTKSRSRELNRYYARKLLCEKIQEQVFSEKTDKQKKLEKKKKQKKRRKRKTQKKLEE